LYEYVKEEHPRIAIPDTPKYYQPNNAPSKNILGGISDLVGGLLKKIGIEEIILIALIIVVLLSDSRDDLLIIALIYILF
jgi:hypothetical protein